MGAGRPGAVITVGALAFALGGGVQALAISPAFARDCTAGGLLSQVTNTVCTVANTVTSAVDSATGGAASSVTSTVNSTVDSAAEAVDDAASGLSSAAPSAKSSTTPGVTGAVTETAKTVTDAVKQTVNNTVTSAVTGTVTDAVNNATDDDGGAGCLPSGVSPKCGRDVRPGSQGKDRPATRDGGTLPTEPPHGRGYDQPQTRPSLLREGPVEPVHRVDVDQAGLPLLIPGQFVPGLAELHAQPVRPRQAYDTLATTLTAVLLLSAVLATRIVAARRQRDGLEDIETLPLSGLSVSRGRHRLAVKL
ncbi:hypothetical protein J5X84_21855 [Streptosporangiaceae bacterium NEAU-GS5]|nr:hypothetical protein [Streptosporangiaceae bacterium NEAU-GS5]